MRLRLGAVLALLLPACSASHANDTHDAGVDAGIDADVRADAGAALCTSAGELRTLDVHAAPEPAVSPGVALLRARSSDRGIAVLRYSNWDSPVGLGGARRLLEVDESDRVTRDVEISRSDLSFSATADFVRIGDEWWVAGTDWVSDDTRLWLVRVDSTGAQPMQTLEIVVDDAMRTLRGPALTPALGGTSAFVFVIRSGVIQRAPLTATGIGAFEDVAGGFDPDTRIAADASDDGTTCIVARERSTGRVTLVRTLGASIERTVLVDALAPFDFQPRARAGDCDVAYYVPNIATPGLGEVRLRSGGSMIGWGGTAPVGLALGSRSDDLVVATIEQPTGRIAVRYLRAPTAGTCRLGDVALDMPERPSAQPLGAILSATIGSRHMLVFGGLTAPGELTLGEAMTAP